jgi:AraC-like DNA-binding protein
MLAFSLNIVYPLVIPELLTPALSASSNYVKAFQFLFGPMVYLYIREITGKQAGFRLKDLLHFFPFFLSTVYFIASFALDERMIAPILSSGAVMIHDIFFWGSLIVQLSVYIALSLKEMHRFQHDLEDEFSSIQRQKLNWMRFFILLFTGITLVYLLLLVLRVHGHDATYFPKIAALALSAVVYGIGYRGLMQSQIPFTAATEGESLQQETIKYRKSGLTNDELSDLEKKLKSYLAFQKPYLEPEISLSVLALRMGLSRNQLSRVINEKYRMTFYNLINLYRLEAAKKILRDPTHKSDKIITVAGDAGFNSKAVFNKYFKKLTGLTPREYRETK